jgi:hypothetical protein
MKSFKDYIKNPVDNPFLDWKSSFGESRNLSSINEETQKVLKHFNIPSKILSEYDKIHDHEDVKSSVPLTKEHIDSIGYYTSTSGSSNINGYLRNRSGHNESRMTLDRDYYKKEILRHIGNLSSAFTSETTNKQPIETYSGIPPHIGERLRQLKRGQTTNLPGFTSTSTSKHIGKRFAVSSGGTSIADIDKPKHIIKFHVHPGAGLSIVPHSRYPSENEILLNHGTKVTYLRSITRTDPITGHKFTVHHMEAHPEERMTLDQYPHEYDPTRK